MITHIINALFDGTNFIFTVLIGTVFFIGYFCSKKQINDNVKNYMPSLAVSIGIFGTFFGVFIGLSGFNHTNISESIPALLEGMKTSFFSSLVGMLASIVLKLIYTFKDERQQRSQDSITCYLKNIDQETKNLNTLLLHYLKPEKEHHESEISYLSKLESQFQDIEKNNKKILIDLHSFLKNSIDHNKRFHSLFAMEFNTAFQAMIEETNTTNNLLYEVKDILENNLEFNKNNHKTIQLTLDHNKEQLQNIKSEVILSKTSLFSIKEIFEDQFNQNRKKSLISLLDEIKTNISENGKSLEKGFNEFSKTASKSIIEELKKVIDRFNNMLSNLVDQSFRDLKESTERLATWQEKYQIHIEKNQNNLSSVLAQLSQLNEIYNNSIEKIAILSKNMREIAEFLESISLSGNDLREQATNLSLQNELLKTSIELILNCVQNVSSAIPDLTEKTSNIINNIEKLNTKTSEFVEHTTAELKNNAIKISEMTSHQIEAIDNALELELTKSLDSFVISMATLSEKFANDYIPLTEKLSKILSIAERIQYHEGEPKQ